MQTRADMEVERGLPDSLRAEIKGDISIPSHQGGISVILPLVPIEVISRICTWHRHQAWHVLIAWQAGQPAPAGGAPKAPAQEDGVLSSLGENAGR